MKKILKTLLIFGIICSLAVSGTAFADASLDLAEEASILRTMYYYSDSLNFVDGTNYVAVIVSTSAFTYIDSIYHDVTIYKNGSLYSSRRYSDTDCQSLTTNIPVSASRGDFITVYVNHYTSHAGLVEDGYNERTYVY